MHKVHNKDCYFDWASTRPTHPELIQDLSKILLEYNENADSLHHKGQRVSRLIDKSHHALAEILEIDSNYIYYTSGASESNSWAIIGTSLANRDQGNHLITSEIEHASVLNAFSYLERRHGFDVDYLPVNEEGLVDEDLLAKSLREDTILVSLFAVNNEIGSYHDLSSLSEIIKRQSRAYFHVDGVQALGKHPIHIKDVDLISYSAHKIGGLKGSGLLIKKEGVKIDPLIHGGQQQKGLRGGTINNPAVILWPKSLRIFRENEDYGKVSSMWDYLWNHFKDLKNFTINSPENSSPFIFNISILNVPSEIMINGLNKSGFYVSGQSTCNSQDASSHVLKALRLDEKRQKTAIRISLSAENSWQDLYDLVERIMEIENYVKQ